MEASQGESGEVVENAVVRAGDRRPGSMLRSVSSGAHAAILIVVVLASVLFARPADAADFARNFGTALGAMAAATGTAVDALGNEYISGNFDGPTLTIGSVTLNKIGFQDAFVAKFDANGYVVWARNFGGGNAQTDGTALAVDGAGNVYLAGSFGGSGLMTPPMSLLGSQDAFAIKLASNGTILWARNFGGTGGITNAQGSAIAVDGAGNTYLGGSFGGSGLTTPPLNQIGWRDAFAIKLDSTGAVALARNFGGSGAQVNGNAIAVGPSGAFYLGGHFSSGNLTTPPLTQISGIAGSDAFAFKLDGAGAVLWARNFGGSGLNVMVEGKALAVDSSGNAYLGGNFFGNSLTTPVLGIIGIQDAFAIKLDAVNGTTAWAKNFGGSGLQTYGNAIAVDGLGNPHLGGYVLGNGNLTAPALSYVGVVDAFAFKLDTTTGATTWAKRYGGDGGSTAFGRAIAVSNSGNVVLGGTFEGPLTSPPLASLGYTGGFAFKIDSMGNMTWATSYWSLTRGGVASINATAVDGAGNIYISGYFNGSAFMLDNVTLTRIGNQDAFAAKIDTSGAVQWARNFGGRGAGAAGQAIAVDTAGGVSIGGTFDTAGLTAPPLPLIGIDDAFAIKLDAATGAMIWAKHFGGPGALTYGQAIAADSNGNVYLGGYYFGNDLSNPPLMRIGFNDGFAFKLAAADGATTWAKGFGGSVSAATYGEAIAVDGAGNVYFGGRFSGPLETAPPLTAIGDSDAFALKLDSLGATLWARNFGGIAVVAGARALAVDGLGNVYLTGDIYGGNLTVPPMSILGFNDAYAIKLDATGTTMWARNFGGRLAQAYGNGIAVDGTGNVYVGGFNYNGAMTTPPLTKIGGDDAFTIKLDAAGTMKWAKNFGGFDAMAHFNAVAMGGNGEMFLGGFMALNNLTTPPLTLICNSDGLILGQTYYAVTYDGNGNNGGSVPVDLTAYVGGAAAVVASNTGGLTRAGRVFAGWNMAANGTGAHFNPGDALTLASSDVTLYAHWVTPGLAPILQSASSRKAHGASGTFDLPLSLEDIHNPTTEPRQGPAQTIVFTFDMPINGGTAVVAAGAATAGAPIFSGNSLIVGLAGVTDQQFVTVSLGNVTSSGGASGGSGSVRVGFLMGDVNQSRVVSIADLGLVNAQLSQGASAANFLKDVNASGTVSLADKGMTNFSLTRALPPP